MTGSGANLFKLCGEFLKSFPRRSAKLSAESEQSLLAAKIKSEFEAYAAALLPGAVWKGDASVGAGNWAHTPWAALYDTRITSQASRGVYPVIHFLFDLDDGTPDGEPGVRLGLGVSVSQYSTGAADRALDVAEELRSATEESSFDPYWMVGSETQRPTNQPAQGGLGRKYFDGMVLEVFVSAGELDSNREELSDVLERLVRWYHRWSDVAAQSTNGFLHTMKNSPAEARNTMDLNTILYGPPGTGKTYRTAYQAVEICDGMAPDDRSELMARYRELRDENRIEFVTFHQSYGYEDFVEGIRPIVSRAAETSSSDDESSQVKYECHDGVFKKLCKLAEPAEGIRSLP